MGGIAASTFVELVVDAHDRAERSSQASDHLSSACSGGLAGLD
jgi:hypothetical protein